MPWSGLFLNSEVIENFLPFGVMEIWRNGSMEVWKYGIMEVYKSFNCFKSFNIIKCF